MALRTSPAPPLDVATARRVLEAVAQGWQPDHLGPLFGRAALVIDLDTPGSLDGLAVPLLPCVIIGFSARPTPGLAPAVCDVLLSGASHPPPPWVGCPGRLAEALASLQSRIADAPIAACTLSQLLRAGETLSLSGALIAESLAYSTLQSGPEFNRWIESRAGRPRSGARDDDQPVVVARRAGLLQITLNRPGRRNAYNAAMRDDLVAALELAVADLTITEVRLDGAGPSFCSGGDLDEFGLLPDPATAHLIRTTRSAGAELARCAERTVAYLQGACVGAGIELPAFAGRVVARPDTRILLPEVAMGLVPGAGGTASIARRVGRRRTAWLALGGEWLDAPTALAWGLVDEVSPTQGAAWLP